MHTAIHDDTTATFGDDTAVLAISDSKSNTINKLQHRINALQNEL